MQTQPNSSKPIAAQWLEAEYLRRKSENPRYSLRSYAIHLEIPPGRLSEILSGKRKLSKALSTKVADKLGLRPNQKDLFVGGKTKLSPDESYALIEDDSFALIADWYHVAFLAMLDLPEFRPDQNWISKRLGISVLETRGMISRLMRLGLIKAGKSGFEKTNKDLRTPDGISSAALRKSHRASILQAAEALETVDVAERDITSITMAIDPTKLPLAKNLIREFRYQLAELLESGKAKEVYNLNVQLVPVTKKEK
jgi:uncharacterized protein (TIGR02147 family)